MTPADLHRDPQPGGGVPEHPRPMLDEPPLAGGQDLAVGESPVVLLTPPLPWVDFF